MLYMSMDGLETLNRDRMRSIECNLKGIGEPPNPAYACGDRSNMKFAVVRPCLIVAKLRIELWTCTDGT